MIKSQRIAIEQRIARGVRTSVIARDLHVPVTDVLAVRESMHMDSLEDAARREMARVYGTTCPEHINRKAPGESLLPVRRRAS